MTKVNAYRLIDFRQSEFRFVYSNYNIQEADANGIVALDGANANDPTLLCFVPNNNFPTGFQATICRLGARQVTITAGTNVNLRTTGGALRLALPNSVATVVYSGNPTTGWLVFGDLI